MKSREGVFGFLFVPDAAGTSLFNVLRCTRPPARRRNYHFVTIRKALLKSFFDAAMIELESCFTNSDTSSFSLEARDEDYDVYLFWPSLNSGTATVEKLFVATHHRVRRLSLRAAQGLHPRLVYVPPGRPRGELCGLGHRTLGASCCDVA